MHNIILLISLFITFIILHPQKKYIHWFKFCELKNIFKNSIILASLFIFPSIFFIKKYYILFSQVILIILYITFKKIKNISRMKRIFLGLIIFIMSIASIYSKPLKYLKDLIIFLLIFVTYEFVRKNFVKKFEISDTILGSFSAEFVYKSGKKINFELSVVSLFFDLLKNKKNGFIIHPFKRIGKEEIKVMKKLGITELYVQVPIKLSKFIFYFTIVYGLIYLGISIFIRSW